MSNCPICERQTNAQSKFCEYHQVALHNLRENYEKWQYALDISWDEYLVNILNVEGLGEWVQEVVVHIMSENYSSE